MRGFKPGKRVALGVAGGVVAIASAALFMNGVTNIPIPGTADLAALMQERSPGAREKGALSKKSRAVAAPGAAPAPAEKKPLPVAAAVPPVAPAPPAVAPAPAGTLPAAAPAGVGVPPASAAFLPLVLPLIIPGDDTTIINSPPAPVVEEPPPPAPPIPEPGTWLMMISGFGLLGFVLRRRRRIAALKPLGVGSGDPYPSRAVRQN